MNRGEVMGLSLVAGTASIMAYYLILYLIVFENLLIVSKKVGYDLYTVESEVWWLLVGFGFIMGLRTVSKAYQYGRRNFCYHCGKELKY